jgi:hypothetical protein
MRARNEQSVAMPLLGRSMLRPSLPGRTDTQACRSAHSYLGYLRRRLRAGFRAGHRWKRKCALAILKRRIRRARPNQRI